MMTPKGEEQEEGEAEVADEEGSDDDKATIKLVYLIGCSMSGFSIGVWSMEVHVMAYEYLKFCFCIFVCKAY